MRSAAVEGRGAWQIGQWGLGLDDIWADWFLKIYNLWSLPLLVFRKGEVGVGLCRWTCGTATMQPGDCGRGAIGELRA